MVEIIIVLLLEYGSSSLFVLSSNFLGFVCQGAEPSDDAYAGSLQSHWTKVDKTLNGGKQVGPFPDVDEMFSIFNFHSVGATFCEFECLNETSL